MIPLWTMLALSAISADQAPTPSCADARRALPAILACAEQDGGIAIAADQASATQLLAEASVGADRFELVFGRSAARYAIYIFDDQVAGRQGAAALRAAGFPVVFARPSPALREETAAEALARIQATTAGPVRVNTVGQGRSGEPQDQNHIPHELGHNWYRVAFWAGAPRPTEPTYGSAAPDWLDEAAAMLLEDEEGAKRYRSDFAKGRAQAAPGAQPMPAEVSLVELTTMTHPAMAGRIVSGEASQSPNVTIAGRPSPFYPQVRVFTDYLLDRSGDPQLLAAISIALRDGQTFETWLTSDGPRHGLAPTMVELQADWQRWTGNAYGEQR